LRLNKRGDRRGMNSWSPKRRRQQSKRILAYNKSIRGKTPPEIVARRAAGAKAWWASAAAKPHRKRVSDMAKKLNADPQERLRRSVLMTQRHAEGRVPNTRATRGLGPNKDEAALLKMIAPLGFRYVGDGKFWIGPCISGKRRNPDFIWRRWRRKIAVLYHGRYWHEQKGSPAAHAEELNDYLQIGWKVFVVPEVMLKNGDPIKAVSVWLRSLGLKVRA
jgi:G:T-mismatch repair DNA endonuclease (very short patch repair protein)